ncbi:MAG: FHA domain-containing protein, partial [Planctomycetota bacterium]
MACLIMTRGNRTQEYTLDREVTLGRRSKNIIRVPEGNASRNHARVIQDGDNYVLEDLNSSNGTYINETRINRQVLNERDT